MGNNIGNAQIDSDKLGLLITAFELYNIAKLDNNVYKKDNHLKIAKNLIRMYYEWINPNYNNMIFNFRRKYIDNESRAEKNDSPDERKGLSLVYDYIQEFDVEKDYFDIFTIGLKIHNLLYKPLDAKNASDDIEKAHKLMEEARTERNAEKYKKAKALLNAHDSNHFGGKLRDQSVVMQDFNVDVPDANEAARFFNSFASPDKKQEFNRYLEEADIFEYIDYAVRTTADLIGVQPFADGNKRTFRSVLNLMFKKKNLPPVYFVRKERSAYHKALEKAIGEHDYGDLIAFYYYKICDSIYELDFVSYIKENQDNDVKTNKK